MVVGAGSLVSRGGSHGLVSDSSWLHNQIRGVHISESSQRSWRDKMRKSWLTRVYNMGIITLLCSCGLFSIARTSKSTEASHIFHLMTKVWDTLKRRAHVKEVLEDSQSYRLVSGTVKVTSGLGAKWLTNILAQSVSDMIINSFTPTCVLKLRVAISNFLDSILKDCLAGFVGLYADTL